MLKLIVALAAISVGAVAAEAATVYTPIIETGDPFDNLECHVLNTGQKEIEVDVAIMRTNGDLIEANTRTIGPGRGSFVIEGNVGGNVKAFCKVEGKFSRRKVLVTLCVEPVSSNIGCAGGLVTAP